MSLIFIFFLLFTFGFFPLSIGLNKSATDSLDALLQDFASKTLVEHRPHTGVIYETIPPANLSGIEISILKIRSRGLWKKGANFSYFSIPSSTISLPHVKRLALVYEDLKNWSSHYYTVPNYSLITSVVGFMAFDASDSRAKSTPKVSLNTMGRPISIHFRTLTLAESTKSAIRCVTFAANGTTCLSEMSSFGVCHSREQGHFSVVVPEGGTVKRKQGLWHWWLMGFVLGFIALLLVGFAGIVSVRLLRTKKIQIMERQADEDLVLASRWVGQSKMPSAAVTRTLPVLENGCFT
ncbi:hypothetical protein PanWU01x14_270570 [Parasponia andersonii]|uniref:Transmembrane protein n=1 Tax=Parasponia andersonii TaxID=3476 RepID=A0A2P5B4Z8_PARAD|nr:hypothetical protein PanWU01x14_270570 [Parasponia andersonii]